MPEKLSPNLRELLKTQKTWVVKIGTSMIADREHGINTQVVADFSRQVSALRQQGINVVLVSSGAVTVGIKQLGWQHAPESTREIQAAASVGQIGVVQCYEQCFQELGTVTAQILLTHSDIANRKSYVNARRTVRELLRLGVVPIINENDAVVSEATRIGENDTLAALICNLIDAPVYIILTDQKGLYNKDPRLHQDAEFINQAIAEDPEILSFAGDPGALGRGGMRTKVTAAIKAARSGTSTVIANGREPDALLRIYAGERLGTLLYPGQGRIVARKQWIAGHVRSNGYLYLDEGAVKVIRDSGKSLLPIGVTQVSGDFARGDVVHCMAPNGEQVAVGLVNYSVNEAERILGQPSQRIKSILGYAGETELIHRDNLVIT